MLMTHWFSHGQLRVYIDSAVYGFGQQLVIVALV
jgi:hypothetical protein